MAYTILAQPQFFIALCQDPGAQQKRCRRAKRGEGYSPTLNRGVIALPRRECLGSAMRWRRVGDKLGEERSPPVNERRTAPLFRVGEFPSPRSPRPRPNGKNCGWASHTILLTFLGASSTFQAMGDPFQEILQDVIPLTPSEGRSKIIPLGQAMRHHVQPGMTIHLGLACIPPLAIIYELIRQFKGKDPRFTLVTLGLTTVFSLLVHTGLIRKAITTLLGDSYPSPGPNPVFQRAFRDGKLEIEHWSLLVQRLKAGALGTGVLALSEHFPIAAFRSTIGCRFFGRKAV